MQPRPDAAPRQCVVAASQGDVAAFRELYDASVHRVHRTARWLLGRWDVDDVVQDVFIRTWEQLPGLKDPGAFEGWQHRLAVNLVLRRREEEARRRIEVDLEIAAEVAAPPMLSGGMPAELEAAVHRLPRGARDVFLLYDVEGYSHKEIARMLGISSQTSRSQLHRARALLRTLVSRDEVHHQ